VNGLLNLAYPLFDVVDGLLGFLPTFLRLVLWGAVSGALAMWLYSLMSNQDRIKAVQVESRELRSRMKETDDAGEATQLAMANLKLAMRNLGGVTGPAMLSGLPVIFVLAWLSSAYGTIAPAAGTPVTWHAEPAGTQLVVAPPAPTPDALAWPAEGQTLTLTESNGVIYDAPPTDPPGWIVHKHRWWNWLLGNPAGYLSDQALTDTVTFDLAEPEILSFGPGWIRGWEFTYLVSLLVVSLIIKFTFKIA
jgi:uncharacterized membrane protein (DUF106 family)